MNPTDELLKKLIRRIESLEAKIEILTDGGRMRQKFWTSEQTMAFLSMSKNSLYKHAKSLGGHKIGRKWLFKPEIVQSFQGNG